MKSIVITGSSSGIGRATAKYFAEKGWRVAATMRRPEKEVELKDIENISLYRLDVTDYDAIKEASEKIISDFKRVDIILNNAGYGLMGPFEKITRDQLKAQFDTNVFGLMEVTRAFLPHFRENGEGMVLNVSSIGGRITFPFMSPYHSTKWAVEGFSESISYELGQFGIKVKLIEPGGVATDFAGRSLVIGSQDDVTAYDDNFGKFMEALSASGLGASTAEFIAEGIYQAATDGKNQMRYLLGPDAEELYSQREEAGDDAFITGMKENTLLS